MVTVESKLVWSRSSTAARAVARTASNSARGILSAIRERCGRSFLNSRVSFTAKKSTTVKGAQVGEVECGQPLTRHCTKASKACRLFLSSLDSTTQGAPQISARSRRVGGRRLPPLLSSARRAVAAACYWHICKIACASRAWTSPSSSRRSPQLPSRRPQRPAPRPRRAAHFRQSARQMTRSSRQEKRRQREERSQWPVPARQPPR